MRGSRPLARSAAAALVVLATWVTGAVPAGALHNYCGPGKEGIHLDGFADGSKDNGHPDGDNGTWSGLGGVAAAKDLAFAMSRISETLDLTVKLVSIHLDDPSGKVVALVNESAKAAFLAVQTAAEAAVLHGDARNAEMNACNDVFMGDMIDSLFVATLEEDLANLDHGATGSVPGQRLAPTALFMVPNDDSAEWSGDFHADLAIPYHHGFIDEQYLGVAVVVRNAIAHMKMHGIATGDAETTWAHATSLLDSGDYGSAYATFAQAYQQAVGAQESTGAPDHEAHGSAEASTYGIPDHE